MEDSVLKLLIEQGITPTVVAVLYYFAYKYLTSQIEKMYKTIEDKDKTIIELSNRQIELVKLVVESNVTLREEIKDGLNIGMTLEAKTDQILKQLHDIRSFIPKH